MIALAVDHLMTVTVLVILAGSLVTSYLSRPGRSVQDEVAQSASYGRPADWPNRGQQATVSYQSAPPPRKRRLVPAVLMLGTLGAAGYAGYFAMNTEWDTRTDLMHLAAAPHCEVARLVGLDGATRDAPGYHAHLDADGNGVSCDETAPSALAATEITVTPLTAASGPANAPVRRLSAATLSFPALTSQ